MHGATCLLSPGTGCLPRLLPAHPLCILEKLRGHIPVAPLGAEAALWYCSVPMGGGGPGPFHPNPGPSRGSLEGWP